MSNQDVKTVVINRQPMELYKIMKFESLVASGGEAKFVIASGLVMVNGATDTRKRRKIIHGDRIEFNGETLNVECLQHSASDEEPDVDRTD